MNTARVLGFYVVFLIVFLIVGQGLAVALGVFADSYSAATGVAVFIPVYYAMYWIAGRAALWAGDRQPAVAAESSRRPPLSSAPMLLAPATLTLELCD